MRKKIKTICLLLLAVCFIGLQLPACGGSSGSGSGTGNGVSGSGR